jgi:2-polyprenyl-3-methyl-5-hydroxy-6-metoxy-1,4-benzoquinol methylase
MKLLAQLYATIDRVYSPARFNRLYQLQFDPYETSTSASEIRKRAVILELISEQKFECALDVGCGLGHLTRKLASVCRQVSGIDFSMEAIAQARKFSRDDPQVSFQVADIRQLAGSRQYDLIVCSEVLYYLQSKELDAAMQRLSELALPEGRLILVGRADDTYVTPRLAARFSFVDCQAELGWSRPFIVSLFKVEPAQQSNPQN